MPITTVIFDYGCVLSLCPAPADFEALRKAIGTELTAFEETYWRYRDAYDLDDLDASGYWQKFGCDGGRDFSPGRISQLADLDCQVWGQPNPVMVEWVRLLRDRGVKTAVISNMSRYVGDYLRRSFPWFALFSQICFSGELKIMKPDPAIFHACLKGLDEPAAQTLFLDDREVNVTGARAVGMHGIVFRSSEQLVRDLEPFGFASSLAEAHARAS